MAATAAEATACRCSLPQQQQQQQGEVAAQQQHCLVKGCQPCSTLGCRQQQQQLAAVHTQAG
jgi:hypothetical protein